MKDFGKSEYFHDIQKVTFKDMTTTIEERQKIIKIILKWKNEGENPTETDLVLENILKEINSLQ